MFSCCVSLPAVLTSSRVLPQWLLSSGVVSCALHSKHFLLGPVTFLSYMRELCPCLKYLRIPPVERPLREFVRSYCELGKHRIRLLCVEHNPRRTSLCHWGYKFQLNLCFSHFTALQKSSYPLSNQLRPLIFLSIHCNSQEERLKHSLLQLFSPRSTSTTRTGSQCVSNGILTIAACVIRKENS